jgi:hypothetical protein
MKVLEKMHDPFRGIAAVLVLGILLLGGCSNLFSEKPGESPSDGEGSVVVTLSPDVAARTLLPSASELFYTLAFTRTSPSAATFIETLGGGVNKTVGLEDGTWDLTVLGYRNPADAYPLDAPTGTAVAEGHVPGIAVSGATPVPVGVNLGAVQTGTGTLRYSLSYPPSPPVSKITLNLEKRGGGYSQTLNVRPGSIAGSAGGQLSLPSGYYDLVCYLYNGTIAVLTDLVHIYDNLETPASFTLPAADFSDPPDTSALESALQTARAARAETAVSVDGADVDISRYWVENPAYMDALDLAIAEAEAIMANRGAGMLATELNAALEDLNDAVSVFTGAKHPGAYNPAADAANLGLFKGSTKQGTGTTLAEALAWLRDNNGLISDGDSYTVALGADESLAPWTLGGSSYYAGPYRAITDKINVTLTLTGKGMERIVSLNANGSLFVVDNGVTLVLGEHITLRGRPANTASLVWVNSDATLVMKPGSKIAGNSSSSSGGGVHVSGGTFTMNGGEVSGNSSSSNGGGVYVSGGTFTMNGGEITGNTAFDWGGGVCVYGTFTMSDGEITGNTASNRGGGVYVYGTFTMSGGEILGNTAYSSGGGVYVSSGPSVTFIMSGSARVDPGNPVYLASGALVTMGGAFTGTTEPVASVGFGNDPNFIGKPVVKWADGQSGPLPVDRLIFPSGWTVDSNGVLAAKSTVPLTASETGAYLSAGATHFYRFTPTLYKSYTVTLTREGTDLGQNIGAIAAWADGSGTLMTSSSYYYGTSPVFIASKPGADIIVMVYNGAGNYTIKLNEAQ